MADNFENGLSIYLFGHLSVCTPYHTSWQQRSLDWKRSEGIYGGHYHFTAACRPCIISENNEVHYTASSPHPGHVFFLQRVHYLSNYDRPCRQLMELTNQAEPSLQPCYYLPCACFIRWGPITGIYIAHELAFPGTFDYFFDTLFQHSPGGLTE